MAPPTPPDDLWARVDQRLLQAHAESRRRRALLGSWRGPIVAGVVVALGLLGALIYGSGWRAPALGEARVVKESVEELQSFIVGRRPLDLASNDPAALQSWLHGEVDFALPAPAVTPGVELLGGQLGLFLQRRVAAYMYRADGHLVALYVMPAERLAPPAAPTVALAGQAASVRERGGFAAVYWQAGGLAYVLISDLPPDRMIALADTLAGAS
jgi:anti-sigma factor RsiW